MTALWTAYGLTFVHGAIVIGDRWTVWPPEPVVLSQFTFELFYAVLLVSCRAASTPPDWSTQSRSACER